MYGHPSPHILRVGPAAQVLLAHHTPQSDPVRKVQTWEGLGMRTETKQLVAKFIASHVLTFVLSLYLAVLLTCAHVLRLWREGVGNVATGELD